MGAKSRANSLFVASRLVEPVVGCVGERVSCPVVPRGAWNRFGSTCVCVSSYTSALVERCLLPDGKWLCARVTTKEKGCVRKIGKVLPDMAVANSV